MTAKKTMNREQETARPATTEAKADVCPACGFKMHIIRPKHPPLITIRKLAGDGPNKFTASIHADSAGVSAPTLKETVRAVLEYLTDEIHTSDEGTCFSWMDACQAAWKELKEACGYLERLFVSLRNRHYPDSPAEPLSGDLMGLITQIDNAVTGWRETKEDLAALKEKYRWVPVGERLPGHCCAVLVTTKTGSATVASRYDGIWYDRDDWREIDLPE